MALSLGTTTLAALYLGSTAISAAYLGSVQVYDAGGAFTPAVLFASGEEGAWYEPSTTTAFRSTTDLTPCEFGTGVIADQQCGFLLDKSQGAGYSGGSFTGLGPELFTFDIFNETQGVTWYGGDGAITIVDNGDGTVTITNDTESYIWLRTPPNAIPLEVGKYYLLRYAPTDGSAPGRYDMAQQADFYPTQAMGATQIVILATYTSLELGQLLSPGTSVTFDSNSFSVRELPGNHATQGTESARPILSRIPETGRRNLLERTEEFDNDYWPTPRGEVSGPVDGAYTFACTTTGAGGGGFVKGAVLGGAEDRTFSAKVEYVNNQWIFLRAAFGTSECRCWFDLQNEVVGSTQFSGAGSVVGAPSITVNEDGTLNCVFSFNTGVGNSAGTIGIYTSDGDLNFGCTSGQQFNIYNAQFEVSSTATAYQKVVSEYDITEAGVTSLEYLAFDGADDCLLMGDVFDAEIATATGKLDVYAAASYDADGSLLVKNGDSSQGEAQRQYALLRRTSGNSVSFVYYDLGNINNRTGASGSAISAGTNYVLRSVFDHELAASGTTAFNTARHKLWQNGVAETLSSYLSSGVLGTIDNGTAQLSIGGQFGTAGPLVGAFSGNLFGLIILAGVVETDEVADQVESYLAAKSGVTL